VEHPASAIARDLAGHAERLCRQFLSNGRREGNYWLVGDLHNTPGRSLYVRLRGTPDGTGHAGKWTDAQSGEHGDLLDIVRAATLTGTLAEALADARRFLSLPADIVEERRDDHCTVRSGSPEAARRLLAITSPIAGTLVEAYLGGRGIPSIPGMETLRFHPRCWYRPSLDDLPGTPRAMPAMIAAVTDLAGRVAGAHRTWLTADGADKASVAYPRRAMGHLLGNGVRFGGASSVMMAGEGIESTLSLRAAAPHLPAIAALSAAHLAALAFPPTLRRLYVAREPDAAGRRAFTVLSDRANRFGIEVSPIDSERGDLNADLRAIGIDRLRAQILAKIRCGDLP